jgi:adenine phosphoribosyltransferase
LETGERYALTVPGLSYPLHLPWVWLPGDDQDVRIASLNLVGQIRWNRDLGRLLAERIRSTCADYQNLCLITVVEKALQLAQVVASELDMVAMAVAYNRVKPHMEPSGRPVIQVGADSITSGVKYLALYERDINLLAARATYGVLLIDDVVTTGGTVLGLMDLLDQVVRFKNLPHPIPLRGVFCVAEEGKRTRVLSAPVHSLARLPDPLVRPGTLTADVTQGKLWPRSPSV